VGTQIGGRGGSMIAYQTNGNVLEVKRLLRHREIKSTMKYIGQIQFTNNQYETTSAVSVKDVLQLLADGWLRRLW